MEKYLAFISYRHQPEAQEASLRLRKGLEGHHLPEGCGIPRKRTVFRDTDELPTSSDLGSDIENALKDSGWLIALCTPEYLLSRWCMKEVETFLELGRKERILPVLLSGTPETSIPEEIRDLPIAADLRGAGEAADPGKAKPAVPELLARMSGLTPGRIARAEQNFRVKAAAAAVGCITAGILGFAGYASYTASRIASNNDLIAEATQETERSEQEALEERNAALLGQADYIAQQAWGALVEEKTDEAIGLALSALPEDLHGDLPVSQEAAAVLRTALSMETVPTYHLFQSVETDFDIDGCYVFNNITDRVFLTEDHIRTSEHYVGYGGEIGDLSTDMADSRQKAIDKGYTKLYYQSGDANSKRHVYCGGGNPLYSEGVQGHYRTDYTLGGVPFPADDMVCGDSRILAWKGEGGTDGFRMALFRIGAAEADAELTIEGAPVSVSFSENSTFVLIVDDRGTLYVFDMKGALIERYPGSFTCAQYLYNSGAYAYAGCEDGTVLVLNLDLMEEVFRISCGSPVRELRANRDKRCLMTRCDSGVYLYHLVNGLFQSEVGNGETPNRVLFQQDQGNTGSDARMILMIYDRRVDLYGMDTDVDSTMTDYRPLIGEGIPGGKDMFYSQDSQRIFQHDSDGYNLPGDDVVYCWDVPTGKVVWQIANARNNFGSVISPSADGTSSWRIFDEDGTALERFDERTGEILVSAEWEGKGYEPMAEGVVESPGGGRAYLMTQMSSTSTQNRSELLYVFDTHTGKELWRMDLGKSAADWRKEDGGEYDIRWAAAGEEVSSLTTAEERSGMARALFSDDGTALLLIQAADKKGGASGFAIDRIDVETGSILQEDFLEMEPSDFFLWEEEKAVVFIDQQPEEVNTTSRSVMKNGVWYYPEYIGKYGEVTVTHTVRIYDLESGAFSAEIPFSYRRSPEAYNRVMTACRPFDGGMALYWEARNEDDDGQEYCCRLNKDGSLGPVVEADSEEGRRLWVSAGDYIVFQGEEAYIDDSKLYRISDGSTILAGVWVSTLHVIVQGGGMYQDGFKDRSLAAAKDGSSICIFSRYGGTNRYPFLIFPSDLDTLVEKGKKRMEAAENRE